MEGDRTIVIDAGTLECRVGFAGEEYPEGVFPTNFGYWADSVTGASRYSVGIDTNNMQNPYTVKYPVKRGIITNWDDIEKIWSYGFNEILHTNPRGQAVLLSDSISNPKVNRERMVSTMMESFEVESVCIMDEGMLSTYSFGRNTSICINSGHGYTHIIANDGGSVVSCASKAIAFGGKDIESALAKLLDEKGCRIPDASKAKTIREIKELLCYVSLDYEEELARFASGNIGEEPYRTTNGDAIALGSARFSLLEAMFNPELGLLSKGIHEEVANMLNQVDCPNKRWDMLVNVLVTGGNTKFRGFRERMERELYALFPQYNRIHVIADENKDTAWIGGSIIGSLSTFPSFSVSRQEYLEVGPSAVNAKYS